jgi:glycosyltransferase involved in cell wall biosynthesis
MYNRWLATLGGGEKLGLSIAEYISRRHPVTVITHTPVSKEKAASRLSLDLSRVEFLAIPERLAVEMTPVTAEYDFFINASFLDYFPSRAPVSATLIYFPVPANLEPVMRFRRRLKFALRRWLMIPVFTEGVLSTEAGGNSQTRWIDSNLKIRLPASGRDYQLCFDLAARNETIQQATIALNNTPLQTIDLPDQGFAHCQITVPVSERSDLNELCIHVPGNDDQGTSGKPQMELANLAIDHPRYRIYQYLFERWFKSWGIRLHYVPPGVFSIIDSVDTYDAIWAISDFSQKWIKKYWDRPSEILTPPVDIEDFRSGQKRNFILNVGRFFSGSHNKKHLVMIAAFKEMVDGGLEGWELHLAGGTRSGLEHENYLNQVQTEAEGYPIILHPDISFRDLVKLYEESAIYWHASGYGEDENREPIKFEHFGITTVEAMASGCVPVVIGKGGQPEIVRHGQNGFLWNSIEELKSLTTRLIMDGNLRGKLSQAALQDSRQYGRTHFDANLKNLLAKIGIEA